MSLGTGVDAISSSSPLAYAGFGLDTSNSCSRLTVRQLLGFKFCYYIWRGCTRTI